MLESYMSNSNVMEVKVVGSVSLEKEIHGSTDTGRKSLTLIVSAYMCCWKFIMIYERKKGNE